MLKTRKMTIADIHQELLDMGYHIKLEVLAQMTTKELKKFRKDAIKSNELFLDLNLRVTECEGRLQGL